MGHRVTVDHTILREGADEWQAFCEDCEWSSKSYNTADDDNAYETVQTYADHHRHTTIQAEE